MRDDARNALAVVVAVSLVTLTAFPLTSDWTFAPLSWAGAAVLCVIGLALRRLGTGLVGTVAGQLVALLLGSLLTAFVATGDVDVLAAYPRLWAEGVQHMQTQTTPMEPDTGVTVIFATVVALVAVLTDVIVAGIRRPAWSVVPLATLFCVPALGLDLDTGLLSFLAVALGYVAILVADGLNRAAAWTRGLSSDSTGFGSTHVADTTEAARRRSGTVVWRAAGLLVAPALVLTAIMGVLLPTITIPGFLGGGAGGNGPLQLTDPSLDLKRNLTQPNNRVVFDYTTDQPNGVYLRMASLPAFSDAGFGNTQIRLNPGSTLPEAVPGYGAGIPAQRTTRVTVHGFSSQYLPLPYAPRSFDAAGEWSYNSDSLVVVNRDNDPSVLTDLQYTVRSWDTEPTADQLASAGTAAPADLTTTKVPDDLPPELVSLSREVTRGADTPAAKAAAIQSYLRDPNNFTYDTTQRSGSGYQALVNFLTVDHRGYCEQFATSMAMMARVNGIPARVAVGFLPGKRSGDTWEVSVRDMHAWPELYFARYGWVRYEPTPQVTGAPPAWTTNNNPTETASPSASPSSQASSSAPSASAAPTRAPQDTPAETSTGTSTISVRTVLTAVGAVVALLLLAAPATIRVRRRQTRLTGQGPAQEQVEAAWAELRDTVLDHGGSWPEGTPRHVGVELGGRLDAADAAAMGRVATLVERSRYARTLESDPETGDLPETTQNLRRAISGPAGPWRRLRAVLAPRSLFRRHRD